MIDRAQRSAAAEMAADYLQLARAATEELRCSQCDITVRRTMEPVASNPMFFVKLVRQAVEISITRQCRVECGVENRHVRHSWKHATRFADSGHIDRIMQGRERTELIKFRQHLVSNQGRTGKLFAAMHRTMANDGNGAFILDRGQHRLEGLGITIDVNTLDASTRVILRLLSVKKAVLQRRRTAVE